MEEVRKLELVRWESKMDARTSSSSRREWQEIEVVAVDVHLGVFKPGGVKPVWVLPSGGISPNRIDIDIGCGVGRDAVPSEGAFLGTEVRDGERRGRMKP